MDLLDESLQGYAAPLGDRRPPLDAIVLGDLGLLAMGTEPMTCSLNAFQTGTDVISLEPGATSIARWGVALSGPTDERT